jgi:hypothetical protein
MALFFGFAGLPAGSKGGFRAFLPDFDDLNKNKS